MSELKARHIVDVYDSYYAENPFGECSQVYLKSEVDKVIALLKDKANYNECAYKLKSEELADTCRFYEDELQHHKYKRCLAMAKWCLFWKNYWHCCEPPDLGAFIARERFFSKWHKRWLKLAKKFKEAK